MANNKDVSKDAKNLVQKILGDVGKESAIKQLAIGGVSGWVTGFLAMKVGKVTATAVGGGIILLQLAHYKGYIRINWDKMYNELNKASDKVEEKVTGEGPKWMDKMERFVDNKLDKAEKVLKKGEKKARRWYHIMEYGEEPFQLQGIHIFFVAYAAGVALGVATGN